VIPVSSVRDHEAYQEFTIGTRLAVARAGFIQRMPLENSFAVESSFAVHFTRIFNSGACSDLSTPRDHIEFEQLVSSRNRKSGWRRFEQLNNKHHRKDCMDKKLDTVFGIHVDANWNIATAGKRGPALLQNIWFVNKMGAFRSRGYFRAQYACPCGPRKDELEGGRSCRSTLLNSSAPSFWF
jgi:hypothetical protein